MKNKHFKVAKMLSKMSPSDPQMGCVIIKKNRIVAMGYNNKLKTHPKCNTKFNRLHAELHAMIGANFDDLCGATVYVYREYKNGKPALAKPCPVCEQELRRAGVAKVYYTDSHGYSEEMYD
ncbi:MAG: deaminase [Thermoplasmatales archaeon]